jgi:hypothetical protein
MSKFANSVGGTLTLAQKAKHNTFSWTQFFEVEKRKIPEAVDNHVIGLFAYKSANFWQMFKEYVGTPPIGSLLSVDPDGLVLDSQYDHSMEMFREWLSNEGLGMELIIDVENGYSVIHMFVFIVD